jgi:hypothetical protein
MRLWLGVTDNDWFKFLSHADVDEVNFWQPSDRAPFVGLEPGAPFLFKLKRPYNHIAGGGTFVKFSTLPLSLAWEVFGIKNGAESRDAFEAMIKRLVSNPNVRDPEIGCTVLTAPFFWPMESWIASHWLVWEHCSRSLLRHGDDRRSKLMVLGSRTIRGPFRQHFTESSPGNEGTLRQTYFDTTSLGTRCI